MLNLVLSILICAVLYVVYRLSVLETEVRYLTSSSEWNEPPLVLPTDALGLPDDVLPDFHKAAPSPERPIRMPSPLSPPEPPQPSAQWLQPTQPPPATTPEEVVHVDLSEDDPKDEQEETPDDEEGEEDEEEPPPPPKPKKPVRRARRE